MQGDAVIEPDGRTTIRYVPDTAAGIKAMLAMLEELGQAPTFDILPLTEPPSNERPWHKHTLPSRRRR